jgi:hypothetical protein
MALNWKQWTKKDIVFGIVVPVIVVLAIVGISRVPSLIGYGSESGGIVIGIVMELLELTVIVAVPLMLGLVWNQWAGGASGFLMGSFYAFYWSNSFHGISGSGTVLLAYILSAMLIGYMAGALNKRSEDFRRMLIAAIVATAIGGVIQFGVFQLSTANVVTGASGFILTLLPRLACGAIIPVVAKVFFWYGMAANKKINQ